MPSRDKKAWAWLWLSVLIIALDQFSKWWLSYRFLLGESKQLLPFLNISLSYNTGAAFSFLGQAGGWQTYFFASIAFIIAVVLIIWLRQVRRHQYLLAIGICLIIGGALGNVIDRLYRGYVIDFIDFHVGSWHYATFNVADSAVCVGALLLILRMLRSQR